MTYDWLFEPCSPEDARDPKGTPWAHAVRGRKPQRPTVLGYGHSEIDADTDARRKAQQQDAREVLGERGEVVTAFETMGGFALTPEAWEACQRVFDAGFVVRAKIGGEIFKMSVLKAKIDE